MLLWADSELFLSFYTIFLTLHFNIAIICCLFETVLRQLLHCLMTDASPVQAISFWTPFLSMLFVYFRSLGWILIIKDCLSFFIIIITTAYWYCSPLLNFQSLFFILIQETLFRSLCIFSIDLVMLNVIHIDVEWKMMQSSYICKIVWVFRDHWCKKAFINALGVLVHV